MTLIPVNARWGLAGVPSRSPRSRNVALAHKIVSPARSFALRGWLVGYILDLRDFKEWSSHVGLMTDRPASRNGTKSSSNTSQTVSRAVTILRAIARESYNGLRLSDISEISGLSHGTTHRLLQTLILEGLVRQDTTSLRYGLGVLNYELGLATFERPYFHEDLHPKLERLANATKETVYLFARSGSEAVCIDRVDRSYPRVGSLTKIGTRRPLCFGAAGLALIARLRDVEINKILAASSRDIERHPFATVRSLKNEIRQIRRRGFSVVRDQVVQGRSAVAAALPPAKDVPPLAVNIGTLTERLPVKRELEFVGLIKRFMF